MSLWTVVGWLLITAAGFGLARRGRSRAGGLPRIPERVARDILAHLAARHPRVAWKGSLPGTRTAVLEVDGQETLVPMRRFLAQIDSFPEAAGALVDRLVDEVRSRALEALEGHAFDDVASVILPQVRRIDQVHAAGGRFGDSALVHRSIGADLAVCYVIDAPDAMTFVCRRHLELWGKTAQDLERLAMSNLRRRGGTARLGAPADGAPMLVCCGDGYDAARVLLLDPGDADDLLLALPDRDVLWIARPDDTDLPSLMARNAEHCARSARPVSDRVYAVRGGRLTTLSDDVARPGS